MLKEITAVSYLIEIKITGKQVTLWARYSRLKFVGAAFKKWEGVLQISSLKSFNTH